MNIFPPNFSYDVRALQDFRYTQKTILDGIISIINTKERTNTMEPNNK